MTWIILISIACPLSFYPFTEISWNQLVNLRPAWGWFSGVFLSQAAMTLFRAGCYDDPEDLMLVEIWTSGLVLFFLGMSVLQLPSLFLGKPTGSEFFDDDDVKTASYNEEKPKE